MQTVTVSPKFPVVIPRDVHKSMQLRPGQEKKCRSSSMKAASN